MKINDNTLNRDCCLITDIIACKDERENIQIIDNQDTYMIALFD